MRKGEVTLVGAQSKLKKKNTCPTFVYLTYSEEGDSDDVDL